MTICIAAICQGQGQYPMVVGATDRMVTAGDIQFEPPMSKIMRLGQSVVALVAGDSDAQAEICSFVTRRQPRNVRRAVDAYCRQLARYNIRQAERKVLARIGLDMKSFLTQQQEFSPDFVDQLMHEIKQEKAGVHTIICGTDNLGPHLYTIDAYGRVFCNDSVGFTAIGDGEWHAQSQFMFAGYTPYWPDSKALLLTYSAKRRAEVAPGVGLETDMFFIASNFTFDFLNAEMFNELKRTYEDASAAQLAAIDAGNERIQAFLTELERRSIDAPDRDSAIEPQPQPEGLVERKKSKSKRKRKNK